MPVEQITRVLNQMIYAGRAFACIMKLAEYGSAWLGIYFKDPYVAAVVHAKVDAEFYQAAAVLLRHGWNGL